MGKLMAGYREKTDKLDTTGNKDKITTKNTNAIENSRLTDTVRKLNIKL